MHQENYIQYAAGYSKENVDLRDIKIALNSLQEMDDEHGCFWVSVIKTGENIIETYKNLTVVGIFEEDSNTQYNIQCKDLEEIQNLYALLLNRDFSQLKKHFKVK